jgi:hypothetical protein
MYTWGASTEEARAVLPGDELVKGNVPCTTRAVTVDAPVDAVWPWLAQIGEDRAGFYSYDALERAVGAHMHNAERVHPEWQRLNPGDTVWLARRFGRQASQTVAVVAPGSHLVLMSPDDHAAVRAGGSARGTWSFYLFPDADRTRLVARGRGGWAGIPVFDVAHFIMERKMLLGLADRAAAALQSRPSSPASDSMAATTAAGSPEAPDTGSAARV